MVRIKSTVFASHTKNFNAINLEDICKRFTDFYKQIFVSLDQLYKYNSAYTYT